MKFLRNVPVVAGGDRHGLEPNAILDLSHGTTLAEFFSELRYDRWSHMVYMPQFRQSRFLRISQHFLAAMQGVDRRPPSAILTNA